MPVFFLILACALWGVSFPLLKALQMEQVGRVPDAGSVFLSAWIQFARFGMGALLLLPFVIRGGPPTRLEWRQGVRLALWGGAGMVLQADGLAYTDASTSAFLTQGYCIVLPIIACIRLRRAPATKTIVATLMVLAGGAVLSGFTLQNPRIGRGELQTLIAAVFFAFQILTLENPTYRGNRSGRVTWVMCATIAVIFLPLAAITAPTPSAILDAGASWSALALVFILAAFCSVGAYLLMNHWQPRVSAVEAGMIYTTEPVFTAFYALFLPLWISRIAGMDYANESLTGQLFIGGALIVAANMLMQLVRPPHKPSIAPMP
ncbi:MAG: DMT family transporter [Akkermansiaceae bacterium]|jgi:drug/metabolite transporter (DMT)-like permease|nr:DMT family transporter [Akkermansiaceae bacterium]